MDFKMIIFKVTKEQHKIIHRLTDQLHLQSVSECIRQVLMERAAYEFSEKSIAVKTSSESQGRELLIANNSLSEEVKRLRDALRDSTEEIESYREIILSHVEAEAKG
jgi:hypothetical protein